MLKDEAVKLKGQIKDLNNKCVNWAVLDEERQVKIAQIMELLRRTQASAHLQRDLILQYTRSITLLQGVLFSTQPTLEMDPSKYVHYLYSIQRLPILYMYRDRLTDTYKD